MPYMQCNGRTVSRYTTTQEVQDCKTAETVAYIKQHNDCMASVECKAQYEHKQLVGKCLITVAIICFIVMIIGMFKLLNNLIDEK